MTQRQTGQRFRQRKLSTKQNLAVLREHEVEKATAEEDAQRHIPRVETGVEKGEEIEHHLQAVISASAAAAVGGKVSQIYIPTPEAKASGVKYGDLYPRHFSQPATYIRFSSTVEDCTGSPYCMTSEDEAWLKVFNAKRERERSRNSIGQCSEDAFEEVISFFEATVQAKQPFAAVDNPPVISYEEIEGAFDETIDPSIRVFARDIYSHWKAQRLKRGNRPLIPSLKIETGQDTDDADPYVCFRRREVRQVRKTRGRDAQVTEKLKKLRKELEDARYLVHMVKQRENHRKEQLALDRAVFEQRSTVKNVKRELGVKGDDEDLINHKPIPKPSKIKTDGGVVQRVPGTVLRAPPRVDGRPPDTELVSLEDQKAERQRLIDRSIEERITQHQNWNTGYHDLTWRPLTPPLESPITGFQPVIVTTADGLPSPPPSSAEDNMDVNGAAPAKPVNANALALPAPQNSSTTLTGTPPISAPSAQQQSAILAFRTRVGRNNRTWLDRRLVQPSPTQTSLDPNINLFAALDPAVADRSKYDLDDDDDADAWGDIGGDGSAGGLGREMLYPVDHYSDESMRVRAAFACGGMRREGIGPVVGAGPDGRRGVSGGAPQMARTAGL
ncbi:MAG: Enhancer of polycomb-like protein 1 [Bathelium mastoideum]|nr:MAG: Enhancer of polycomb-like protein 1 [Bathelium mastoideum]